METKDRFELQFRSILEKAKITDYNVALALFTKMIVNQTNNNKITKEVVEKKYGSTIKQLISTLSNININVEINDNLPPIIKKRNTLFMRSCISKFNKYCVDLINLHNEKYPNWNDELFDYLKDYMKFEKDKVLVFSKLPKWEDIEDFFYEYLQFLWNNPDFETSPTTTLSDTDKAEFESFYHLEVPKPEEEKEEEKPSGGQSSHRLIIYFITDTNFRDNYATFMKEFAEKWITENRTLLGADAISRDFFRTYRDKFRKDLHPEDQSELVAAISKRINTYLKAKNIQDLYDENRNQILKGIQDIIETIIKDESKFKVYSKMTGIEMVGRLFELLCMDRNVGGIVSGVPDPVMKDIRMLIKKKYKNHEIFHMIK